MINRKNKNKVKNALKKLLDDESENNEKEEKYKSLKDYKKSLSRKDRKNFRKEIKEKNDTKVDIKWNIKLGDLVSFEYNNTTNFGLVVRQSANGKYRSLSSSGSVTGVLVMSSVGRLWLKPKQLDVII